MSRQPNPRFDEYLTVGEAAEFLGVSPWTLRNWDRAGKLKTQRHPKNGYRIYHHDDLVAVLAAGASGTPHDPSWNLQDAGPTDHIVQFYERDEFLVTAVTKYLLPFLTADGTCIVVATAPHRSAIEQRLLEQGLDLKACVAQERLIALDADETLSQFVVNGELDLERFQAVVGSTVTRLANRGKPIRAFGEMVALLCARGRYDSAVRLEELWGQLARQYTFSLLCAYPIAAFEDSERDEPFSAVCTCHSRVLPAENYATATTEDERLRIISRLQQRSQSLEAEVRHRRVVERRLEEVREDQANELQVRRSTEEALRRSEAELHDFFENASLGLHWAGPEGTILRANRAELDMLGYAHDEYVGRHIADFHVDRAVIDDVLRRLAAGEVIRDQEARLRCKDGTIRDVLINSSVLWDKGQFIHTRCFTQDITERKRAVDDLRSSEERFRLALAGGAVTAFELDLDLRYTWIYPPDPGFPEHNLGKTDAELLPPAEAAEQMLWKRQVLATRQPARRTFRVTLPREVRYYDTLIEPRFDAAGQLIGLGGSALNVTRQTRTELALREADRKKDEFLAVLAHELRNPLAPVRNALQIMRLAGDNRLAVDQARAMMERQVQQMVRIVDDLLDLSRITRGKVEIKKERVALSSILASAIETSRPLIEAARHLLHLETPAQSIEIEADPTRLAQVLSNLLNNAAKYSEPGGEIWVTAACADGQALISVKDRGIGIPAEMLSRIFEMFTQVERPGGKEQGGLGVGLTLVRSLMELHGGTVEAQSGGPGCGSVFTLRLPLAAATPAGPSAENGHTPVRPRYPLRRVLVVDDSADAAQSLAMLLRILGQDVRTAPYGQAALEIARDFQPELAFLDISMPGMSGYDLARRLRAQLGDRVHLVALTGWSQDDVRRRARAAGFNTHLPKPADPASLEALIQQHTHPAR